MPSDSSPRKRGGAPAAARSVASSSSSSTSSSLHAASAASSSTLGGATLSGASLSLGALVAVALATAFSLARFSEAFLVLRGQTDGLSHALAPVVMIVMNIVYAGIAAPAGALSDRMDHRVLLALGLLVLLAADLVLGLGHGLVPLIAGCLLYTSDAADE